VALPVCRREGHGQGRCGLRGSSLGLGRLGGGEHGLGLRGEHSLCGGGGVVAPRATAGLAATR
jgi:hypothetical protein